MSAPAVTRTPAPRHFRWFREQDRALFLLFELSMAVIPAHSGCCGEDDPCGLYAQAQEAADFALSLRAAVSGAKSRRQAARRIAKVLRAEGGKR